MIDPDANEAAMRYLSAELERAHLFAAQLQGNLVLVQRQLAEALAAKATTEEGADGEPV